MTRAELLKLLVEEAKRYRKDALKSVVRNQHMNELTSNDMTRIKKSPIVYQRLVDALLVDFINNVAAGQCVDYGLYTKDLTQDGWRGEDR